MKNLKKIMMSSLINLPTPTNINTLWNLGFVLGLTLMIQLLTGVFLASHYNPSISGAFLSISHISKDVNFGSLIQSTHMNAASLFFIIILVHMSRGLFYNSYKLKTTWMSGSLIFIVLMLTAFLGYILPWGQMSFWGATVITNLLTAIPYLGTTLAEWVWGGFSVDNATLNRFFVFHFLFPFILAAMATLHLFFLHETGSSNPLGTNSHLDKTPFTPSFALKDLMILSLILFILLNTSLISPFLLSDPENFIEANPMITPVHIQPEWYFLFAYAILRSIPNKLGGVIALASSILVLFLLPLKQSFIMNFKFSKLSKTIFWSFVWTFVLLTWIGANPVEPPFIFIGQSLSFLYFTLFMTMMI